MKRKPNPKSMLRPMTLDAPDGFLIHAPGSLETSLCLIIL